MGGYDKKKWIARLAQRSDLSACLTHLTRSNPKIGPSLDPVVVLFKILREKKLIGSTPQSGFLHGTKNAVCFQDAPPHSVVQNLWFEQKLRESGGKIRYEPCGLMVSKPYVFRKGGRPVVYDKPEAAKAYLPPEEWWRIVHLDLGDDSAFVDWTHEREWRVAGDFDFELDKAYVPLVSKDAYHHFIELCRAYTEEDILSQLSGVVTLSPLLF